MDGIYLSGNLRSELMKRADEESEHEYENEEDGKGGRRSKFGKCRYDEVKITSNESYRRGGWNELMGFGLLEGGGEGGGLRSFHP